MLMRLADLAYPLRSSLTGLAALTVLALTYDIDQLSSAPPDAAAMQKKADPSGDSLPDGALARLGTLRWRHAESITFAAFGPNETSILTASQDNTVRLWDRASGKEIRRFDIGKSNVNSGNGQLVLRANFADGGSGTRLAVTRDGKILATVLATGRIKLWDVETGKEIRQFANQNSGFASLFFSPDGKTLGATGGRNQTTHLFETATGKQLRQFETPLQPGANRVFLGQYADPSGQTFTPDGKKVASVEMEVNMKLNVYIRIVEADTGKEVRRIQSPQSSVSSLAYSPNGKVLAFASGTNIHLRDPDSDTEIRRIYNRAAVSSLIFSHDGKTVIAKGQDQVIRLWDTQTGKSIREVGEVTSVQIGNLNLFGMQTGARDLALSKDGRFLLAGGGHAIRLCDIESGKERSLGRGHRDAIASMMVSPDGRTMLSYAADNILRCWNTATGLEIKSFASLRGATVVVYAPDGRTAAVGVSDGSIRLIATDTGKELRRFNGHQNGTAALVFSSDGKKLASRGSFDNLLRVYDVAKGTEIKQLTLLSGTDQTKRRAIFFDRDNMAFDGHGIAFSPDGQLLAVYFGVNQDAMMLGNRATNVGSGNHIRLFDIGAGKEIRQITLPPGREITNIVFSPDGRLLGAENRDSTLSVWELSSGKERAVLGHARVQQGSQGGAIFVADGGLGQPAAPAQTLAFSPDGELLAARGAGNVVRVFDVPAAKEIGSFQGHTGEVRSLVFHPDGRSLASGSADTTILLWDMKYLKREPRGSFVELKSKDMADLWSDLVGSDASKASRSMQALITAPKLATSFLRDQLKPAPPLDVKKLDRWVTDLDSDLFKSRVKAADELERLGDLAIPALTKALKSPPTLESRRRVESLVDKLTSGVLNAEQIRLVRAVEVLEKMGSADARSILETLGNGAPGALATRHAQAALDRLNRPQMVKQN